MFAKVARAGYDGVDLFTDEKPRKNTARSSHCWSATDWKQAW